MTWMDDIYLDGKGSFRGVEFFVKNTRDVFGRKTKVHIIPGRSYPEVEDLGRRHREFNLTCFVVGSDYHLQMKELLVEFETEGVGQLVHPFFGEFTVKVIGDVVIDQSFDEGGMARFQVLCLEVRDTPIILRKLEEPEVKEKADAALVTAQEDFEEDFSLVGAIESVRNAAVSVITEATQKMREARAAVNALNDYVDDVATVIDQLEETAASLLNAPGQLFNSVTNLTERIFTGASTPDIEKAALIASGQASLEAVFGSALFADYRATRTLEVLRSLTSNGNEIDPVDDTGSTQDEIESQNQAAIVRMNQINAVIEAARALSNIEFDTRDKALEARKLVCSLLADYADNASDATFSALMDLRAEISEYLKTIAEDLPSIVTVQTIEAQPSLVIMYDIYGSIDNETGFVELNDIEDPSAVPGFKEIQVVV